MRRVSVVVPTHNRPAMLREALASIRALDAEYEEIEFEVIVGDNGRTEVTRQICAEFAAIYAPATGRGASYARNAAMKLASGEFVAFLDDDDVWTGGHIRPQIAELDANPAVDAVFGQATYTDHELRPTGEPWPEQHPGLGDDLARRMLGGLFPQIGTVVARRSVIETVGYFDIRLIGGQDLDWLLRLAVRNKLGYVATPCILFRGRPNGTSDELQRMRIGFDRRVFLRHALPNALRLWKTPVGFVRAYHSTLIHYWYYFRHKAIWFAERGRPAQSVRALATPALYLPALVAADLLRPTDLSKALLKSVLARPQTAS
jgi:glycosyltransferase involved in cell wall biosynthesis